ncbi:MAG: hypothetical protein KH828_13385 [Clostridiales bacterium]|nr:hypothetical protein [Clostridiales bacterium]
MAEDWMNNPSLSGIDPAKMALLQSLLAQGKGKSQNDMMSFLMGAANTSQQKGLQFTPDEMDMIVDVLKMGKPPQEVAKINKMLSLIKMMKMRK